MQSKAGASFLVLWLVANAVGGFLTGALEGGGLQFFATILLQGPILGIAQALALWRVLPRAGSGDFGLVWRGSAKPNCAVGANRGR